MNRTNELKNCSRCNIDKSKDEYYTNPARMY